MQRSIRIERVQPSMVRPLRAAILRPGRPARESIYPLDDDADAAHFGAIDDTGAMVGSASIFRESADGEHVPVIDAAGDPWRGDAAWRLRGMTVVEAHRGTGFGALLIQAVIDHIIRCRGECLWFHARAAARGFYERHGCCAIGSTYDVPHIGEHVFMWRTIEPRPQ